MKGLDKIVSILDDCNLDYDCMSENFSEYYGTFTPVEIIDFTNFLMSQECHDICMDKLSKFDESIKSMLCASCMTM